MKKVLLTINAMIISLSALAFDIEIDSIYYDLNPTTKEAVVVGGVETISNLIIPKTIKVGPATYTVTEIRDYAFGPIDCYPRDALVSVEIPNTITIIGEEAFDCCRNLDKISIPESVNKVGANAFNATKWFNQQPDGEMVYVGKVAYKFKGNNPNYTNVVIKEGIISIAPHAFDGCSNLKSITLPSSLETINEFAFYCCSGLSSIIIPEGVTCIGSAAFERCTSLTSITIPESVTSFQESAFKDCSNLESITLPKGITKISHGLFYNCTRLVSVSIPDGVTIIEGEAFSGCSSLSGFFIPNSVISCEYQHGLDGTEWYKSQPDGLIYIGRVAYRYKGEMPKNTEIVLKEGTTEICDYAFMYCTGLSSIIIPEGVLRIGDHVFTGCTNLKAITIPEGVVSIGWYAFGDCKNLETINNPESISSIGHEAYHQTKWYSNQPDGLLYIGKVAYKYKGFMPENTAIEIKEGTTCIADGAFKYYRNLTSVVLPSSLKEICGEAFSGCGLTSVVIPKGVELIENGAFDNCDKIETVEINMEEITGALSGLSTINKLVIGEDVKKIDPYAFEGCENLETVIVNMPKFLKCLPEEPNFSLSVYLGENVKRIEQGALPDKAKVYAKPGSMALFAAWNAGNFNTYDEVTNNEITISQYLKAHTTQTTMSLNLLSFQPNWNLYYEGELFRNNSLRIDGLKPGSEVTLPLLLLIDETPYNLNFGFTTKGLNPHIEEHAVTGTTLTARGSYDKGDAKVVSERMEAIDKSIEGTEVSFTGLDPLRSYKVKYYVTAAYGKNGEWQEAEFVDSTYIVTKRVTFKTLDPKVLYVGEVIVAAETNITNDEEKVGFEWRRSDAPEEIQSKSGEAYLYEGMLEGILHNLTSYNYWRYRPYYVSTTGKRYYGDWGVVAADDYSYFEPTVHTYAKIDVYDDSADVKGYAMRGSDDIDEQGFMYWEDDESNNVKARHAKYSPSVPTTAKKITAEGNVMTATLTGLSPESKYCYMAFVKTVNGQTYYGEQLSFTTNEPSTGIEYIENNNSSSLTIVARYDLQGRKINVPTKGINILRLSDGTTRRVFVK